ncbi:MAG: hypothetical protein WEC37_04120, partial [Anaerolineales bacterium]
MLVKQEVAQLKQGYTMRPVSLEDGTLVTNLVNQFSQVTLGLKEADQAEIVNFWSTPGVSMANDLRVVLTPEGKAVGYVESLTLSQPPVHPFIWLRLHPDHSDEGVGEALIS